MEGARTTRGQDPGRGLGFNMMLTERMKNAFGYDEQGNCESLLANVDKERLEKGDWIRTSGESVCSCGSLNRHHPPVQGCLWLTRTCDGLVKF